MEGDLSVERWGMSNARRGKKRARGWGAAAMIGVAAAAPGLVPTAVSAQRAMDATVLDPVTSTATKSARTPWDTPFSVNVVGPQEIERRQPQKLDELVRDIPGVEMADGPRRIGQQPMIRGFGGSRVVTTIDGARQNLDAGHKGSIFIEPDLLKQVEVLKGSGSALYGSGAIGGLVALTTKDASDFLSAGERFGMRTRAAYSTGRREPLGSQTVFGRPDPRVDILANAAYRRSGTMQLGGDRELPYSAEDMASGLFKTTFRPAYGHRASFSAQATNEEGSVPIDTSVSTTNRSEVADRTTRMRAMTFNYAFADDENKWLAPNILLYRTTYDIDERRLSDGRRDTTALSTDGIELRNSTRFELGSWSKHRLTYGAEYFRDAQEGRRNGAVRTQFPDSEGDSTGFYLQDEIALGHGVTLIPGARWDKYDRDSEISSFSRSDDRVSPRLGAQWQAMPWLTLFGSYSEGFRAPGLTELFVAGLHFPGNVFITNPNLRPETTKTWEGGLRLRFNDVLSQGDQVRLSATYFTTKADDFIELVVAATTTTYRNITKASIDGAELEALYDSRRLFGGVGLARIRGTNDQTSQPIDTMPADKAVLRLGSRVPELDMVVGWRSEFAAAQDEVSTAANKRGGYGVHFAYLSWLPSQPWLDGLRADFGVNNIFDKHYQRVSSFVAEEGRDFRVSASYTRKF